MTDIFIRVAEMSMTASIVIGVIIVLRLFLRKAPKVFSYVLWAAALFRLFCPISFELPSAPIPTVEIPYSSEVGTDNTEGLFIPNSDNEAVNAPEYSEPQAEMSDQAAAEPVSDTSLKRKISLLADASYIWAAAVVIMIFRGIISWIKLSHSLRSAQKLGENVYGSAAISDPFIMGIVRPKIYLPTGLSSSESDLIIRHEKAHMHRGDHIAKLVMYGALCVHCFNPFVWVMFRLFERDMEMSCDEKVTANMTREQKAEYSQTLLKISAKPTAAFTACFGENDTKKRVKNVLSFKYPAVWVVVVLTVLAAAVSVMLCANGNKSIHTDTINETYPCGIHDSTYTEPTLKDGIFISDNEQLFFMVKNNSIRLMGDDPALKDILYKKFSGHITSANGGDLTEEAVGGELVLWKNMQEYTVSTLHGIKEKAPDNSDAEGVYIVVSPFEYSISNNLSIAIINENTLKYIDTYFHRLTSFDKNAGKIIALPGTDAFSAEAYLLPTDAYNDKYVCVCTITNHTSDELRVNLSYFFSLCYSSDIINPTANTPTNEYVFAPNESKDFVFDVETILVGDNEDTKEINGSCVLEITNSDKYKNYNVLEINSYIIEKDGDPEFIPAMGKNGNIGYVNAEQLSNAEEYYEHYRIEITDEEELNEQYEHFYPQFGSNVYDYKFYKDCVDVPIFDENHENIVDHLTLSSMLYEPSVDDE